MFRDQNKSLGKTRHKVHAATLAKDNSSETPIEQSRQN